MRVLHVLSRLDKGGAESRILEMQRNLYDKGVTFDYLLRSGGEHFYTKEATGLGSTVYVIPQPSAKKMLSYIRKVKNLVSGNYDIVHSHLSVFSGFVLLGAKLGGAKVRIAHSRSGPLPEAVKQFPIKKKLLLHFYHWLIRHTATHLVSCSTDAATYLFGQKAVKQGKVIYIRNAIDFHRFDVQKSKEEIRRELGVDEGTELFVNVGNLLPVKNQTYLIDTFAEYQKLQPNSALLIAGEGPERGALEAQIAALKNDGIRLLGRCDTVPELLSVADYFIMTSKYEGVPGAAIEAMASGVPCFLSERITRDIDFGAGMTEYFDIAASPAETAILILKRKTALSHDTAVFRQILVENAYELQTACEQILAVYNGNKS